METSEQLELVQRFAVALASKDEKTLHDLSTEDIAWTIPGDTTISGAYIGIAGLLAGQDAVRAVGINVEIQQSFYGSDSVVAMIHATGSRNGKTLDVTEALVVELRDDKVARMLSHIDDPEKISDYLS